MSEVRIFTSERCLEHAVPPGLPECPERLLRVRPGLDSHWQVEEVAEPRGWATEARRLAALTHDPAYLDRFDRLVAEGARIVDTQDNPVSSGSARGTWAALETCLVAADWAEGEPGRRSFALTRPPGHHAEYAGAMGFCFVNHVAVVARGLLERGAERVAIVDFDVHHGNGTQHIFEEEAEVFYASLHQAPFYPGTGAAEERGRGAGVGTTLNVPLRVRTDGATFVGAFRDQVVAALDDYAPQALLVSAGFDAWQRDPLGGMALDLADYETLGRDLAALAERHCEGRMTSILEGGYDLEALPELVEAYLEGTSQRQRSSNP